MKALMFVLSVRKLSDALTFKDRKCALEAMRVLVEALRMLIEA